MIGALANRLRSAVASFWDLEDPEDRIEGSGEVYLDPAYNGRYTAERSLRALADEAEQAEADAQETDRSGGT